MVTDSKFFCEVIGFVYLPKNITKTVHEPTEQEKMIATNAVRLLQKWRTPPGIQDDGGFDGTHFNKWLKKTWDACSKSGHLEVALSYIGKVLFYCPADPSGLWINKTVAEALNRKDTEEMRSGFRSAIIISRGACVWWSALYRA